MILILFSNCRYKIFNGGDRVYFFWLAGGDWRGRRGGVFFLMVGPNLGMLVGAQYKEGDVDHHHPFFMGLNLKVCLDVCCTHCSLCALTWLMFIRRRRKIVMRVCGVLCQRLIEKSINVLDFWLQWIGL